MNHGKDSAVSVAFSTVFQTLVEFRLGPPGPLDFDLEVSVGKAGLSESFKVTR